jgi:hypothetical protein
MIIAKLELAGACLKEMEIFLTSVRIHLTGNNVYQKIFSNIVADICKVLTDVCFMENIDNGVMSDYYVNK